MTIYDPPFERWKTARFTPAELSNPLTGGDAADSDHDGLSNFLEYAFAGNPRLADAPALPALSRLNAELRLYYAAGESDLSFEVQQSPSLTPAAWTHNGVSAELYDAASGLLYQSAPIAPGEPAKFLRLQIIRP